MLNPDHAILIASELNIKVMQVGATLALLEEGATVPFISRYRKEVTGSLDEVAVAAIRDRSEQLAELETRREAVVKSVGEQGKLTPELEKSFREAATLAKLEDLYLPYRPKRKTRAMAAREKGLEPLADLIFAQTDSDPLAQALPFVNAALQVAGAEEALAGARDILAERINENAEVRGHLRELFAAQGRISSKVVPGQETEGQKFKDYFDWEEALAAIPSHRLLAILRGRNEDVLIMKLTGVEEAAVNYLRGLYVRGNYASSAQVGLAVEDAFKRLLQISLDVETVVAAKRRADEQAIAVFADNLRQLLLAPPLGEKRILALDPGFRTGCKVVALDAQGKLLLNHVIYPHPPQEERERSAQEIKLMCRKFSIEAVAIGNGTAGRETEEFIRACELGVPVVMVNESGASIYSASEVAREEFPDFDLTVRGAVSIGRRLLDPLAELVKIDPKSIGVGQYQHDVNPKLLKQGLDDIVISCVNAVGVDVNTASKQILTYVSGLGPKLAQSVVEYRNEHGAFASREDLKKVPRLSGKAFEQAAGFLRIRNGAHPLDGSAVHPERYELVAAMARDLNCTVEALIASQQVRRQIKLERYVSETVGLPTLTDILQELDKPGRDPRKQFELFNFAEGVHALTDLKPGLSLPGIVTNVTNFGAFVDIGVHQDGLVHVSELADTFVPDIAAFIKVSQRVQVRVLEVDLARQRIALSLRSPRAEGAPERPKPGTPRGGGKPGAAPRREPQAAPKSDWQAKLLEFKHQK